MKTLRKLSGLVDGLNDVIGAFIRWLALFMVLVGATSAVARYFARSQQWTLNLTPATEAQWYMFSVIFLLGAAYGLNHNVHVRVDVVYERMSAKVQAWIDLAGTVMFLVPFSIMMLYVSYPAVRASWSVREVSPDPGGLPRYPIKALILVSFVLLLLQAFSQLVKQVDVIRGVAPALDHHAGEPEVHV
ncbi:MAG: TRAP transporter small permease subunit [Gemmatimonadetes bacterium]|nr:TRAP transporter small permease subunit [Gemmatimonadota bacterium]MDA1104141.1 TRAP transporter small permease subunit [Gemmatimonadota bacterium]